MITLAVPMRPHVVIGRGMNGLPTVHLRGMGDGTCYDATSGDAIPCPDGSDDSNGSGGSSGGGGDTSITGGGGSSGGSSGSSGGGSSTINLTALAAALNAASSGIANGIRAANGVYYPAGTVLNPATGLPYTVTATASVSSLLIPIVGIGLIFLVVFAMKK